MNIRIRPCTMTDLDELQRIGYETYDETFRPVNTRETINAYLEEAFNKDRIRQELNNKDSQFFFLYLENELAGYLKINDAPTQTDINDPESIELERLYVRKEYKGKGLGRELMIFGLRKAKEMKKHYVWLGVWEKNVNAINFYTKMGFHKSGDHLYRMGEELQNDHIMKKEI